MLEVIIAVVVGLGVPILFGHSVKKQEERFKVSKRNGRPVLRKPRLLSVMVMSITLFLAALMALIFWLVEGDERFAGFLFLPFVLFGCCFLLVQLNWRLVLEPDSFVYIRALHRKRVYAYRDIQSITLKPNGAKLEMPDCRIRLPGQIVGTDVLLYRADLAGAELYDHRSQKQPVLVRSQLAALAALGISSNSRELLDSICEEVRYDAFLNEPYSALLNGMGFYGGKGDNLQPVSNQVFSLDLQCITRQDSYALLMLQFYRLASGECTMADMISRIDPATSRALITFQWNGKPVNWSLPQEARLFNRGLLVGLNHLLEESGSEKRFCSVLQGMRLTVVFIQHSDVWELNRLTGLKFTADM